MGEGERTMTLRERERKRNRERQRQRERERTRGGEGAHIRKPRVFKQDMMKERVRDLEGGGLFFKRALFLQGSFSKEPYFGTTLLRKRPCTSKEPNERVFKQHSMKERARDLEVAGGQGVKGSHNFCKGAGWRGAEERDNQRCSRRTMMKKRGVGGGVNTKKRRGGVRTNQEGGRTDTKGGEGGGATPDEQREVKSKKVRTEKE